MGDIRVVAAVIRRGNQVLLASRPMDKPPCGWEFPGGKIEKDETPQKALLRELREELALDARVGDTIYIFRKTGLSIEFIRTMIAPDAIPAPQENQSFQWYALDGSTPDGLLKNDWHFWQFLLNHRQ
ncbi:MAG: NUDIX domain-containing protein [Victivallaceae bacterium]|nr:NUDIX domain-containing protein [Victivallaceae bacterium]